MTLSPAGTTPVPLEEVRSPATSPYGGVEVDAWIERGSLAMQPSNPRWQAYWRDVVGVTVGRATAGTAQKRSDRPRWFWAAGIKAERLPFAAPGCPLPPAITDLDPATPVAVAEMAVPEDHARYIQEQPDDPAEVPRGGRWATVLQVRPKIGDEKHFVPFYFAIPSDGLMPRGHLPLLSSCSRYVGDVVGAWLPRNLFVVVCNEPQSRLRRVLQVTPSVPPGTPVVPASEFVKSGFWAVSWPRGTRILGGKVRRESPWPEEYTPGLYPAVAVRPDGTQVHIAIWIESSRSPTPSDLSVQLRRLSQSQEHSRPSSRTSMPRPRSGNDSPRGRYARERPRSTSGGPRSTSAPLARKRPSHDDVFCKFQDRPRRHHRRE